MHFHRFITFINEDCCRKPFFENLIKDLLESLTPHLPKLFTWLHVTFSLPHISLDETQRQQADFLTAFKIQ